MYDDPQAALHVMKPEAGASSIALARANAPGKEDAAATVENSFPVRIATSAQTGSAIEPDDFLANNPKRWRQLNLRAQGAAYVGLPESISVGAQETKTVSFTKGAGNESLLILLPNGRPLWNGLGRDGQSQTVSPKYKVD